MSQQVEIRIIRSVREIEDLRPFWAAWQKHPNVDVDFYETIVSSRPEILRPHVIVLYRGGCPDAMLVGRLEDGQVDVRIGYKTVFAQRARFMTFIYGGLLGSSSPDNCQSFVREISRSLRQGEADVALLHQIRVDTPLYQAATRFSSFLFRDHFRCPNTHRSMTMAKSVEDFHVRLSPKVRKNQKWQAKNLLRTYQDEVNVACFSGVADLERMIRDVEAISRTTYQRGLGVGFVDNAETRNRLRLEAEKGWLRVHILYVANQPCAFWMGTLYQGTFHSDFMGYDPQYAKCSPGMFLIMRVIESFCSQNGNGDLKELDFGFGDAQYKEVLGTDKWEEVPVLIFAPTLKGFALNVLQMQTALIDLLGRKTLGRTNLAARVKKMWRQRVRKGVPETSEGG